MIFLFGGLGMTPRALNIVVDHVLFFKVVLLTNKFLKDEFVFMEDRNSI